MEKIFNAVNLRLIDKGDYDKIVVFLTPKGKFSAMLKGVKRGSSKQKYAGELFSHNQFVLAQKGDFFTITSATNINLYYEIRKSYEKMFVAGAICSYLDKFCFQNEDCQQLFDLTTTCLERLCNEDKSIQIMCFFLFFALKIDGFELQFQNCCVCGKNIEDRANYNIKDMSIACGDCEGLGISPQVLHNLKSISQDNLQDFDLNFAQKTLKLLSFHLENCAEKLPILDKCGEWL